MKRDGPKRRLAKLAAAAILALAGLAILSPALNVSANREAPQQPQAIQDTQSIPAPIRPIRPVAVVTVNFEELARAEKRRGPSALKSEPESVEIHPPMTIPEPDAPLTSSEVTKPAIDVPRPADVGGSLIGSPAPSASFVAQLDEPKVGTSSRTIPPDTTGAVGATRIFSTLNSNYRIQNKADGATLSTVSMDAFWAPLNSATPGPSPVPSPVAGAFDPRIQYDPYTGGGRWIVAAVSNNRTPSASVLVGISASSDPQGTFTLYRFVVGCAAGAEGCDPSGEWADFPMLGFNKNWIAVGWNQFRTAGNGGFVAGKMLILDYPALLTGTATSNISTVSSGANFCMHPATTYSATEEVLYVPVHISSAGAAYQLHRINKKPDGSPELVIDGVNKSRPGGGWTQPGGDTLPQTCVGTLGATCPGTPRFIDSGDSFIRSNVVFRNGSIWYAQTIGLPAGRTAATIDRTAAQWTRLDTTGAFVEGGRIDDANANTTNGEWYAYPSIAVNANGDLLLGFSNFSWKHFARAAYAMRPNGEASMRDPALIKEGEDYYSKSFTGTRNRWGDYSHTIVDPDNDLDFWTIQEYASTRSPADTLATTNASRWGTWWAKISPGGPPADPLPTPASCATALVVNDTGDAGDATIGDGVCATAGGVCTLRAALDEANARMYCGTISITFSVTGQITLTGSSLVIAHNVNITGPGAGQLTVRRSTVGGTPNFRIIEVRGAPTIAISGVTLAGGNLTGAGAGIFFSGGVLTLTDVTFSGNTITDGRGGGLFVNGGTVLASNSSFTSNAVLNGGTGGGIYLNAGTMSLIGSSVSGNTAGTGSGGGIFSQGALTINSCVISNNSAQDGGGIFNSAASLTVINSTISNNASAGAGGGIQHSGGTSSAFHLIASTIANNTSSTSGGGIAIGSPAGTVGLVINSTISGNTARENGGGVLLSNAPGFTLNIVNSTITANRANLIGSTGFHGGGVSRLAGTASLRNTIVSGNFNGLGSTADDVNMAVDSSSSFNLVGACNVCGLSNGTNGNQVGVTNALLGPLANNGGPTLTHALLTCSPALNAGSNALALDQNSSPLVTDQRGAGFNRISNGTVDIGAFELQAAAPTLLIEQGNDLAAVDSVTRVRGPFALNNNHNFSSDQRTRIVFFATDLGFTQLSQPDINTLSVQIGGNSYAVEAVGPNSTVCGWYVVFRLPDLAPNTYQLGIRVRGVDSANTPNFTIVSSSNGPAASVNSRKTQPTNFLLTSIIDLLL